jgi:Mg2+ and Co2+ transporter CorA
MIADSSGVRPAANAAAVRAQMSSGRFFWLDLFGGEEVSSAAFLGELALEGLDIGWALRFGQAGRMQIGQQRLRAVTWMAPPSGELIEVHVFGSRQCILTIWQGDGAALDEIRVQFSERAGGLDQSLYQAAGILLELLLGTLDHAMRNLDLGLDHLRMQLDKGGTDADVALLSRRLQRLQTVTAAFNRYSSAVRSAIVGIEAVPGMDARGAAELNEYAEQVEDLEEQLYERRRWMSDIMHDHAMAIAQRQGEQINRLTLVSLIFLPMTALTGFFGMNFNWMIRHLASGQAFVVLGVLLPLVSLALSVAWFMHRGFVRFNLRRPTSPLPSIGLDDPAWPIRSPQAKTTSASDIGDTDTSLSVEKNQLGPT